MVPMPVPFRVSFIRRILDGYINTILLMLKKLEVSLLRVR